MGVLPAFDAPAPQIALTMIGPSIALTLIPALLMGVMFPLIVDFYATNIGKIGRNFGRIYGFNTLGGILAPSREDLSCCRLSASAQAWLCWAS